MSGSSMSVQGGMEVVGSKKITWRIKRFDLMLLDGELVKSQKFLFDIEGNRGIPKTSWSVTLSYSPRYFDIVAKLSPNLENYEPLEPPATIIHQGKAQVLDPKQLVQLWTKRFQGTFKSNDDPEKIRARNTFTIMETPKQRIPLFDGDLVIEITMEVFGVRKDQKIDMNETWIQQSQETAKQQYLSLLKSGDQADVKLVSKDNVEFPAHKLILRTRSEVFDTMLQTDMVESATGVIHLKEMSSFAVKFLLHFIYGFDVPPFSVSYDLPEDAAGEKNEKESEPPSKIARVEDDDSTEKLNVEEVLHIAGKYRIDDLKNHVDQNIGINCNEKNAWFLYCLCKTYSLQSRHSVKNMITENPSLVERIFEEDEM